MYYNRCSNIFKNVYSILFLISQFKFGPYDVMYFADICAGPGGFSEYVLWKKTWNAKGFGFTLKSQHCQNIGSKSC